MTLLEIRTLFIEHSGRFDLVEDTVDFIDDGADFFIQTGQRVLDDMVNVSKNESVQEFTTTVDTELLTIPGIRTVEQVWVENPESDEIEFLRRMFFRDFRQKYNQDTDTNMPKAFALYPLRNNGADAAKLQAQGILLGPTPDKEYTLSVRGRFYSHALEDDADFNYWSLNYPHTLIQAALFSLERFYRNTQGMQDHLAAIRMDLQGIDFEEVETMVESRPNMSDSFNERRNSPRKDFGF